LITDGIFQRKHYHTGKASVEANNLPPKKSATKEHFYGRKKSASQFINMLMENSDLDEDFLFNFIKERCHVHSVTSDQNKELKKYNMTHPDATWEEAYAAKGIILEQKIDRRKKKTC
jgi:hypothetical protein